MPALTLDQARQAGKIAADIDAITALNDQIQNAIAGEATTLSFQISLVVSNQPQDMIANIPLPQAGTENILQAISTELDNELTQLLANLAGVRC